MSQPSPDTAAPRGAIARFLDTVERVGNKLPDPAMLFLLLMLAVWALSWALSGVDFQAIDPRTGTPIQVVNQLSGESLTAFMANMVRVFLGFAPLAWCWWRCSDSASPSTPVSSTPRCVACCR